jgi:hypothetical protein
MSPKFHVKRIRPTTEKTLPKEITDEMADKIKDLLAIETKYGESVFDETRTTGQQQNAPDDQQTVDQQIAPNDQNNNQQPHAKKRRVKMIEEMNNPEQLQQNDDIDQQLPLLLPKKRRVKMIEELSQNTFSQHVKTILYLSGGTYLLWKGINNALGA